MNIRFIGDAHGLFSEMEDLISPTDLTIQVGDLGVGFPNYRPRKFPNNFKFIRGNHDNPEVCRNHPNYLGDYGVFMHEGLKIFYLSGAWSVDRQYRTEGTTWWPDEQLSYAAITKAIDYYEVEKPDIVVTHDCPAEIAQIALDKFVIHVTGMTTNSRPVYPNVTNKGLQEMFNIYKPKLWVFGHYHVTFEEEVNGTRFICLDELDLVDIDLT